MNTRGGPKRWLFSALSSEELQNWVGLPQAGLADAASLNRDPDVTQAGLSAERQSEVNREAWMGIHPHDCDRLK